MSQMRQAVATLLAEDLTLNEITHRLGVARSTVGYHADELREQQEKDAPAARSVDKPRRPVAAPNVTRERVRHLLELGYTRARTAEALGLARSTVTYHAGRLGRGIDERCARRYDWQVIRRFYEEGHSATACPSSFGFSRGPGTKPYVEI